MRKIILEYVENGSKHNSSTPEIPRRCGRQTQWNNVQADTPKQYFKLAIFIPFFDSLLQQFSMHFGHLGSQAVKALILVPSNCSRLDKSAVDAIHEYYREDLISCFVCAGS